MGWVPAGDLVRLAILLYLRQAPLEE